MAYRSKLASDEPLHLRVPSLVKRTLAILSFSLALCASAMADERGFSQAINDWRALFRPLATAREGSTIEVANAIVRDHTRRFRVIEAQRDRTVKGAAERRAQAIEASLREIGTAYGSANPKGRRALVRASAVIADRFLKRDVPFRPGSECFVEGNTLEAMAETLVGKWIAAEPSAHLGLLDDPEPRVAYAGVRFLHKAYADEVTTRIRAWRNHPQARFRGLALDAISLLGREEAIQTRRAFLDDPSEDIRDDASCALPYEVATLELANRRAGFERSTRGQRKVVLQLAYWVHDPDILRFALPFLNSADPKDRRIGIDNFRYRVANGLIPAETLARLRKDSTPVIRESADTWSGLSQVPMKELRPGLEDPEGFVREAAFEASCAGAETGDDLRLLLKILRTTQREAHRERSEEGDLHERARSQERHLRQAFARLDRVATPETLLLLRSKETEERRLGTSLACGMSNPTIVAALAERVKDPQIAIRAYLASEARELPKRTANALLNRLLADPAPQVRKQAKITLKELESADR